ncbi:MAG: fibronectin type III domain-containing protein [Bdellovibrionales bacterium]|nr:fibronectin type III domain-containing protein [Bdellovibrionales bacterium]
MTTFTFRKLAIRWVPFFAFALIASGCKKIVDRSYFGSAESAGSAGSTQNAGPQDSNNNNFYVVVSSINCAITTPIPNFWRNNSSETFAFNCVHSTGKKIKAVDCQVNDDAWTTCQSMTSHTLTGLTNGIYRFRVRGTDADATLGTSPYATWGVDRTAPTITSASLVATTDTSASLTFAGSDSGGSDLKKFQCRLLPIYSAWSDCTAPINYFALTSNTPYSFYVKAFDNAGNASGESRVDFTTRPFSNSFDGCVFTSAVAPNSRLRTQAFNFQCHSPSNNLASVECRLDYNAWVPCDSPTTHQVTNLSEGNHIFNVRYVDNLGNRSPSANVAWKVNSIAPIVEITSAQVTSLTPGFTFTGRDSVGDPLAGFTCQLIRDGSIVIDWTPCTSPKNYTSGIVPTKSHTFNVKGTDFAGNESVPASYTWTAPNVQPPSCAVSTAFNPAFRKNSSETINFTCSSPIPLTSYECRANASAPWTSCTSSSSHNLTGLQSGQSYAFSVRATDSVGNVGQPSLALNWGVDLVGPTTSINTVNNVNQSATIQFTATDTGGSGVAQSQCQLDGVTTWTACTNPVTYNGLTLNTNYTFRVKSIDVAGNVGAESSTTFRTTPVYVGSTCTPVISTPLNSGWTNQTSVNIGITCNGTPPAGYECKLDSGAWASCTSPTTVSAPGNGPHTFYVRPIDGNGTPGPSDQTVWNVDTSAPDVTITGVTPSTTSGQFTLTSSDSGGSGIAKVECQLELTYAWAACTSPLTYSGLSSNHNYTVSMRATDRAGNVGPVRQLNWATTAPPPAPPAPTCRPSWAQSAYGGYYDATGCVQGAQTLPAMRGYGGTFGCGGVAVPTGPVYVNATHHICGEACAAQGVCFPPSCTMSCTAYGMPMHLE